MPEIIHGFQSIIISAENDCCIIKNMPRQRLQHGKLPVLMDTSHINVLLRKRKVCLLESPLIPGQTSFRHIARCSVRIVWPVCNIGNSPVPLPDQIRGCLISSLFILGSNISEDFILPEIAVGKNCRHFHVLSKFSADFCRNTDRQQTVYIPRMYQIPDFSLGRCGVQHHIVSTRPHFLFNLYNHFSGKRMIQCLTFGTCRNVGNHSDNSGLILDKHARSHIRDVLHLFHNPFDPLFRLFGDLFGSSVYNIGHCHGADIRCLCDIFNRNHSTFPSRIYVSRFSDLLLTFSIVLFSAAFCNIFRESAG